MANEPQPDIEQDLQAYKRRRAEQLAAPIELHPATRRMLQGEVARKTGRPILASEETAKNFARSFMLSHQQPGFFARHQPRLLWGGGMFACLAVALLVLRNDPASTARQNALSEARPTSPPTENPQPTTPPSVTPAGEAKDTLAAAPTAKPELGQLRESAAASRPVPTTQRGVGNSRADSVSTPPAPIVAFERGRVAAAPVSGLDITKAEDANRRLTVKDADADRKAVVVKFAEKSEAGESAQLARALKPGDGRMRVQATKADGSSDAPADTGGAPKAAASPAVRMSAVSAGPSGEGAALTQQFKQLDTRSLYRQNFNSPPVPPVMQDFAFERSGDRVRIVDADGSTYEGNVLPIVVGETLAKPNASVGDVEQEIKARAGQSARIGSAPAADAQIAYRFIATGLNRKLNQSVEFHGEWQPGAPIEQTSALRAVRLEAAQLESKEVEKRKLVPTNALSVAPARAGGYSLPLQPKQQGQTDRISGRAVVGGRNEFEINAVPK